MTLNQEGNSRPRSSWAQVAQAIAAWLILCSAIYGYITTVIPIASKARLEEEYARLQLEKVAIEKEIGQLNQQRSIEIQKLAELQKASRLRFVKQFMETLPNCAIMASSGYLRRLVMSHLPVAIPDLIREREEL
jgi:hypothetical protein